MCGLKETSLADVGTASRSGLTIRWPGDVRLSDLEPRFTCQACGRRANVRPNFDWEVEARRAKTADHAIMGIRDVFDVSDPNVPPSNEKARAQPGLFWDTR
jgi:hypothetical protein